MSALAGAMVADPTRADDILDLAKSMAVLPPDARAVLLAWADELLEENGVAAPRTCRPRCERLLRAFVPEPATSP